LTEPTQATGAVPAELHELIERFDRDLRSYRSARFNEAQARIDFINPFLGLLGWDVENRQGLPEAYREVVYEDRVKVGAGRRPRTTAFTPEASAASSWRRRSPR
jgi:hypothetical protein